jgi:hypothetical protein
MEAVCVSVSIPTNKKMLSEAASKRKSPGETRGSGVSEKEGTDDFDAGVKGAVDWSISRAALFPMSKSGPRFASLPFLKKDVLALGWFSAEKAFFLLGAFGFILQQ